MFLNGYVFEHGALCMVLYVELFRDLSMTYKEMIHLLSHNYVRYLTSTSTIHDLHKLHQYGVFKWLVSPLSVLNFVMRVTVMDKNNTCHNTVIKN